MDLKSTLIGIGIAGIALAYSSWQARRPRDILGRVPLIAPEWVQLPSLIFLLLFIAHLIRLL